MAGGGQGGMMTWVFVGGKGEERGLYVDVGGWTLEAQLGGWRRGARRRAGLRCIVGRG